MSRRGNGEGTVVQLPNKKWKAVVSIVVNGKRRRPSRTTVRKSDAYAALVELRALAHQHSIISSREITVEAYLVAWLRDVVAARSASTHDLYKSTVDNHIVPHLGTILLAKLRALELQGWIAHLQRSNLGTRTVEVAYTTLRNALNHAADRLGMIPANPLKRIKKPSHAQEEIIPLTMKESLLLLELTTGSRYHAFYRLALSTGMRQGELLGLRWDHVDIKSSRVLIDQQATEIRGVVRAGQKLKTESSRRSITLTPATVEALQTHRAILMKEGNAGRDLVFPSREGDIGSRGNFRVRVWKPLLAEADIKYRGFHHVRHTYATIALGAGTPIAVVSQTLGHSKVSITHDIYSHVLESHTKAATATMARLFG